MTIIEMHTFFDLICDKYASPYFSVAEKDIFINKAISSFIEDVWFNYKKVQTNENNPPYGGESTIYTLEAIQPLITNDATVVLDANSVAAKPAALSHLLNIALGSEVNNCGEPIDDVTHYCRFVRHNDVYKHIDNSFKKPTVKYPRYTVIDTGYKVYPLSPGNSVTMSYIKKHTPVVFNTPTNCQLPGFTHGKIMMLALSLAGLAVREQSLRQGSDVKRNEGIE